MAKVKSAGKDKAAAKDKGPSVNIRLEKEGRGLTISTFLSHFSNKYSVRVNEYKDGFIGEGTRETKTGKIRRNKAAHVAWAPGAGPFSTYDEAKAHADSLIAEAESKGWSPAAKQGTKVFVGTGVPD